MKWNERILNESLNKFIWNKLALKIRLFESFWLILETLKMLITILLCFTAKHTQPDSELCSCTCGRGCACSPSGVLPVSIRKRYLQVLHPCRNFHLCGGNLMDGNLPHSELDVHTHMTVKWTSRYTCGRTHIVLPTRNSARHLTNVDLQSSYNMLNCKDTVPIINSGMWRIVATC